MTLATLEPPAVGSAAPPFTLLDQTGAEVSLSDFAGERNVLLVFYPFAFSGICAGELSEIRDSLERFVADDLQVLTISCDPMYSLRAWADAEGFFFPMLSDFWPHGAVARAYGVFDDEAGMAVRGTFLVDTEGVLRWSMIVGADEQRDFRAFDAAIAELRG